MKIVRLSIECKLNNKMDLESSRAVVVVENLPRLRPRSARGGFPRMVLVWSIDLDRPYPGNPSGSSVFQGYKAKPVASVNTLVDAHAPASTNTARAPRSPWKRLSAPGGKTVCVGSYTTHTQPIASRRTPLRLQVAVLGGRKPLDASHSADGFPELSKSCPALLTE